MAGLYFHIPFCSRRCVYCDFYFVTTRKVRTPFVEAIRREIQLYADEYATYEPIQTLYFGGGTPSYISVKHLEDLVRRLKSAIPWDDAEEVTFECEPGTLNEGKLQAIRALGVTRLSLGVENFDDRILELNGRAHRSAEVFRAYEFARKLDFPQINVDLIAGMLGETEEIW